jgi:hypothetical protein
MHIKKELVVCDFFSLHFKIQNGFSCQAMASLASFAFVSSIFLGFAYVFLETPSMPSNIFINESFNV